MHLSYFIARRYLFAKKSHNVINIISTISSIGIAVGSCALIMVLSIYNGFEDVVKGMYDRAMPGHCRHVRHSQIFPDRHRSIRRDTFHTFGEVHDREHRRDRIHHL